MLNPNGWDVLAFLGSIIGGIITWTGVKKTIKHSEDLVNRQRTEKEIDEAAKKTRMLDNIAESLELLEDRLSNMTFDIVLHENEPEIREWIRSTHKGASLSKMRELVDESIHVDASTYKVLVKLEKSADRVNRQDNVFFVMLDKYEHIKGSQSLEDHLIRLGDLARETQNAFNEIVQRRKYYLRILFPNENPDDI